MLDGTGFPRIISIKVPTTVRAQHIGDYVSHKAAEIITGINFGSLNRRSINLRPTNNIYLYLLSFDTTVQPSYKDLVDEYDKRDAELSAQSNSDSQEEKSVDTGRLDNPKSKKVAKG